MMLLDHTKKSENILCRLDRKVVGLKKQFILHIKNTQQSTMNTKNGAIFYVLFFLIQRPGSFKQKIKMELT